MKSIYSYFFIVFFSLVSFSQIEKERKMHRLISTPTANELAPNLTPNGNTMIFMKKTTSSKEYHIHITTKTKGQWDRPVEIPQINKHSSMLMLGGYCISPDGKEIVYSTKKHPSIGGYDLWSTKKEGNTWSTPSNIGAPINTKTHEGMPTFSADGKSLFFIRGHIHQHRLSGNVYVSKKRKNSWSTPTLVETPENISQVQQTATKSHFLLNNTKEIFYYNPTTKTKSKVILNDPYVFFTINYKHDKITYSKELNDMYDIFEGIIRVNKDTPKPTLQYKIKKKELTLVSIYNDQSLFQKKVTIKPKEIKTFYFDEPTTVCIQNKALHFATDQLRFTTSKSEYNKSSLQKAPIPLSNDEITSYSLIDIEFLKQYLNGKNTKVLNISYTCPEKKKNEVDSTLTMDTIPADTIDECKTIIINDAFFGHFTDFSLQFTESTEYAETPKWSIK